VTPQNEDISGQHGQMIWSNELFPGTGELLAQSSGLQLRIFIRTLGTPCAALQTPMCFVPLSEWHKGLCQSQRLSTSSPWDCFSESEIESFGNSLWTNPAY